MDFSHYINDATMLLFLGITVIIGIVQSRGMKTFEGFALSRGFFSPKVILCTVVASFVGGGVVMGAAEESFSTGIVYMVALVGFSLQLFLTGVLIAPRTQRFSHLLSIGDIVQETYGRWAQLLMGLFWLVFCIGIIAVQIKALGAIFNIFSIFSPEVNLFLGAFIVIFYSSFGGIRAVVATDVIQFIMMVIALPLVLFFSLKSIVGVTAFIEMVPAGFLSLPGHSSWIEIIPLFLSFLLADALIPPVVQRLLMVQKSSQARWSYVTGAFLAFGMIFMASMFGMSARVLNPTLDPHNVISYLLQNVVPFGFSMFATLGFVAVIMSTADSYLNSASIALVNDILKPFRARPFSQKRLLLLGQVTTLVIGFGALFLTFMVEGILPLLLHSFKFWGPTVLVPVVAIFFTKNHYPKAFFMGCTAGVLLVLGWEAFAFSKICHLDSLIPGIVANFLVFVPAHLLMDKRRITN
jgi:SSS family solute:Na+ symporter